MTGTRRKEENVGKFIKAAVAGAAAGAAGVTALNAVTYLDMVVRARPASDTPEQSVRKLSEKTGITIPGNDEERTNRVTGLGPLLGIGTGVVTGVVLGGLRGLGWRPNLLVATLTATGVALVAGNAPMTLLKVSDPRTWSATAWISDLLPHLAYGAVAGSMLHSRR
jgi:hypothetical protein